MSVKRRDRNSLLLYAVRKSFNENWVCEFIDSGADVNKTDSCGKTVLFDAAQLSNNESVIQKLIDAGADVNITDNCGKTALFDAVQQSNNESVVSELISAGADVNIIDQSNRTALFYAVQNSDNESVIRALIDAGADVNISDNNGQTVLLNAVKQSNDESVVRALTDAGADLNMFDNDGKTALFNAVKNNNESVIFALIDAGADVNRIDNDGKTALFNAVKNNNECVIFALIDAGADVNRIDNDGKTALFDAVKNNNVNVIRALIDAGADVNITDNSGQTALLNAVKQSNDDNVVRALTVAGADVNITDNDGKTALIHAVLQCSKENEMADTTILDGFVVFIKTESNYENVRTFITAGADVNVTDNYGKTALFYAVQESFNENVVRSLVDACSDIVTVRDIYGRTAIFYANINSSNTFSYLLEKGGNGYVHLKDNCNVDILTIVLEKYLSNTKIDMKTFQAEIVNVFTKYGTVKREIFPTALLNIMFRNILRLPLKPDKIHYKALMNLADLYKEHIGVFGRNKKAKMQLIIMLLEEDYNNVSKALQCLVELGADPNSADSDGNTALHLATRLPLLGATEETVMDVCHRLQKFGGQFNARNHQNQTPLLFCLSGDMSELEESKFQPAIQTLVKVCMFLMKHGSNIEETSRSGESVFHLILKLFQKGLQLHDKTLRKDVLHEMFKLLHVFRPAKVRRGNTVNKLDVDLNSPLHLWATLALLSPEGYTRYVTTEYAFENLLQQFFNYLSNCGAKLSAKNENDETPLHLCKTWSAVKILIKAGANPNDVDSSGRLPLLVAVKNIVFVKNLDCFYPDVSEDPKSFWENSIGMGLDPWTADRHGETVLSVLIESQAFNLAKSLVDIACEENYTQSEAVTVSLLNAICKDKSIRTHWKTVVVQEILKSRKCATTATAPLRLCCKNIIETGVFDDVVEGNKAFSATCNSNVHCEILKVLRLYGANGKSCLDIAKTCSPLEDLLTKPIDIDTVPVLIPWAPVSVQYEEKLCKVAKRQECNVVNEFWLHKEHIGNGSFGHVFAGINEKDGREVAIKRLEKLLIQRPEDKREIENLTVLADCEQVVRYLYFFEDENFSYVVLELMEGSLDEYLDRPAFNKVKGVQLCEDIVKGLNYLHKQNILHRDLKPGNILYKTHPKLCLKIADFGLSRRIELTDSTTVYGSNVGTRSWIAPEVLKSENDHSKSSDMFSCGLLLHYLLSVKKHPFSPDNCFNKGEFQIAHETEANIISGNMEGWDNSHFPETTHMVKNMLKSKQSERPTASEALNHPLFWSQEKKIDLLTAVGNQPVFEYPRARKSTCLTVVEADLEKSFNTIVRYGKWNDPNYSHMPAIYAEMTQKRKSYDTCSVVELVRFIRNAYSHVSEDKRSTIIRKLLLEDFVFLDYFPHLVMEVYKVVTTHGWDQTRDEIKYAMNK